MGCAEIVRYLARRGAGRVSSLVLAAPSLPFRLKTPDNPDGVERSMVDDLCARMTSDLPQLAGGKCSSVLHGRDVLPDGGMGHERHYAVVAKSAGGMRPRGFRDGSSGRLAKDRRADAYRSW